MASDGNLVVVTGFGPYRNYIVNSSWEAVKELEKLSLDDDVHLKILELPVKYSEVEKRIKKIWAEWQPKVFCIPFVKNFSYVLSVTTQELSVHVGMMASSKVIALEQCGRNKGYTDRDISGAHPQEGCCLLEGLERIESSINMKSICKNISLPGVNVIYSRDAGRYLCEYAYYISLYCGNGRAVFIHVPQITKTLTAEKLGQALQKIIQEAMRQLE